MKSHIGWKGMLITLGVLILFIGTFRLAKGDITFPHTFTSGTTISASEVNANFNAINARQSASLSTFVGTYTFHGFNTTVFSKGYDISYTYTYWNGSNNINTVGHSNVMIDRTCSSVYYGTMIFKTDGTISISGSGHSDCNTISIPSSGTYTVNADGSGTISMGGRTLYFQASKDLNGFGFHEDSSEFKGIGSATRI